MYLLRICLYFCLMSLISSAVYAQERVKYQRGETFHLEFRSVFASEEVTRLFAMRKDGEFPVSWGYPLSRAAQEGRVKFVDCPGGIHATIRVSGLAPKSSAEIAKMNLDVLGLKLIKTGMVRVSRHGDDWIEFSNFDVAGGRTIVLPYKFQTGRKPIVSVIPIDFVPNPGFLLSGNAYEFDMSHRTFAVDGQRINVGMIVPIVVDVCRKS